MPYFTYMLVCSDESLYTGWTTDLEHRLRVHNEGKGSRYTRARLPVELLCYWEFSEKPEAMRWEVLLKRLPRPRKLACLRGEVATDPEPLRFVIVAPDAPEARR